VVVRESVDVPRICPSNLWDSDRTGQGGTPTHAAAVATPVQSPFLRTSRRRRGVAELAAQVGSRRLRGIAGASRRVLPRPIRGAGGVRPDRVEGDRSSGRRRAGCVEGDRHRSGRGPSSGMEARRRPRTGPRQRRQAPVGHRSGRDPGHLPLGEGTRCPDVQTRLRVPSRCAHSSTTAPSAPVSRWRSCCAPVTPARTPPPTTSLWSDRHWPNYPPTVADSATVARS